IASQVCDGLHHAHTTRDENGTALNLVHRDVKPSNVIINPQGVVKVLDFGISKALVTQEKQGAVRGTWGYMSPEQAAGRDASHEADQYGLACVLYELATLVPLFPEKQPEDIARLMGQDEGARRSVNLTGANSRLSGVLMRALQRDPAARFDSARSMGKSIAGLVGDPVTAREQLVQFQRRMADLAAPAGPGREPLRSDASFASVSDALKTDLGTEDLYVQGLPVSAGDRQRPVAPRRTRISSTERWVNLASVLFLLVALCIVGFTGWRLFREPPAAVTTQSDAPEPELPGTSPGDVAAPEDEKASQEATETPPPPGQVQSAPAIPEKTPEPTPAPVQAQPEPPREQPAPERTEQTTRGRADAPRAETDDSQPRPKVDVGRLTVGSTIAAQVLVDGRFIRYAPMYRQKVTAGTHEVVLVADDGRRKAFNVHVPAGADVKRIWSFEEGRWAH
ncbi:MAG: protein kinase, partial [Myxococcota bacterium]|nr:protein kinase [Myxococcota bacterium]